MGGYEKEKMSQIVQNMGNEEYEAVLQSIPSEVLFDELKRREKLRNDMIISIIDAINGVCTEK